MLDFGPGSFFLTRTQLEDSPSARHGISAATEKALRLYACEIIQEAGILLRLPQAVAATAQVLLHRFFCKQSFLDFDARSAATSCLWLSMKLEEEEGASNRGSKPSQLNDVVSMFEYIRARREGTSPLPPHAPAFKIRKEELLKLETRILVELGFVCHVEHPHKLLLGYLNCLEASKELIQECWNLVNDSLRTTLCLSFSSSVISCGIIYAAARRLCFPLPESPPWWLLFDVTLDQILKVCIILTDLYRQPKSQFVDVQTPLSEPVEVESSSSEVSPVLASTTKSPDSEASHIVSMPTVRPSDVDCGRNGVPVISPASASKILNSCFMGASGLPSKVGEIAPVRQHSSVRKKRERESPEELETKSKRYHSSHERAHDRWDRRRDYRHAGGSQRDTYRDCEQKSRRHENYPRCSSSYQESGSPSPARGRTLLFCRQGYLLPHDGQRAFKGRNFIFTRPRDLLSQYRDLMSVHCRVTDAVALLWLWFSKSLKAFHLRCLPRVPRYFLVGFLQSLICEGILVQTFLSSLCKGAAHFAMAWYTALIWKDHVVMALLLL